jgi:HSP20 family protein
MMSNLLARRQSQWLPDPAELFSGFPTWADLAWFADTQVMRLEDEMEDGRYVVRAEIPGVDPVKDIDIMVRDRKLTIKAERTEKEETKGRSEFRYGSFVRSVTLPESANADDVKATYDKGILTVSVGAAEQAASGEKHIAVRTADRASGKRHRRHWRHSR